MKYRNEKASLISYPLGGTGAGMMCMKGTGGLTDLSLFHHYSRHYEPYIYAAIHVRGSGQSFLVEGTENPRDLLHRPGACRGLGWLSCGLPRYRKCEFTDRFPFGIVRLQQPDITLASTVTGWSPFIPGNSYDSSLPVCAMEYSFVNTTKATLTAVFSINISNFMNDAWGKTKGTRKGRVYREGDLLILESRRISVDGSVSKAGFSVRLEHKDVMINPVWFRGGVLYDDKIIAWQNIKAGRFYDCQAVSEDDPNQSGGGTAAVEFTLSPGEQITIPVQYAWHVPRSSECTVMDIPQDTVTEDRCYKPWYSEQFGNVVEAADYWRKEYSRLKEKTEEFTACFYNTSLPAVITDAVAANLAIMKSPTVLREKSGRIWGWEGCSDNAGCCAGSSTHVWNYAQAFCHLFPDLERSLRKTEFFEAQFEDGFQNFRHDLPIAPSAKRCQVAAADGQLGGIMKLYRDWKISGDMKFLREFWPKAKKSLEYCIKEWDPGHAGVLTEPHHNTYDIEFWGPDGMCSSFYLGALKAASLMAERMGEDSSFYNSLYEKGRNFVETELFNGEYFEQKVQLKSARVTSVTESKTLFGGEYPAEALEMLKTEGPKYQYGKGCLADGILGAWMAHVCGLGEILEPEKVKSHLLSVYKYNFISAVESLENVQRSSFALGKEGGLLICTWPKGGRPSQYTAMKYGQGLNIM